MTVMNMAAKSGGRKAEDLSATGLSVDSGGSVVAVAHRGVKACWEVETDQESNGSSEETESPRSVMARARKWPAMKDVDVRVHSQILRIREEDSHLGEDTAQHHHPHHHHVPPADHVDDDVLFSSRHALPSSPLKGKTEISIFH